MGHHIQAFLGAKDVLNSIRSEFNESRTIELSQCLALLPVTDELYDAIPQVGEVKPACKGFKFLDTKIIQLLSRKSALEPVGYIETDYFGGLGTQGAILARKGEIVFGPQVGPNSINGALRLLGMQKGHSRDEFEALGLGKFRDNEDMIES